MIIATKTQVVEALRDLSRCVPVRPNVPKLASVWIHANEGQPMALSGTSLDEGMTKFVEVDFIDSVDLCVPQRRLMQVVQAIRGSAVSFKQLPPSREALAEWREAVEHWKKKEQERKEAVEEAGQEYTPQECEIEKPVGDLVVSSIDGKQKFVLRATPADDFKRGAAEFGFSPDGVTAPDYGDSGVTGLKTTVGELIDAFSALIPCISTEETRYYLNGVFFHPPLKEQIGGADDPGVRLVSTDGHKLMVVSGVFAPGQIIPEGAIIPRQTINLIYRLNGIKKAANADTPVEIYPIPKLRTVMEGGKKVERVVYVRWLFKIGDHTAINTRLIDGNYPDYERVIPEAKKARAVASTSREGLREALKGVMVMTDTTDHPVRIDVEGEETLKLTAYSPEAGTATETLEAENVLRTGESIAIGVNGKYLHGLADVFPESRICFDIITPQDPLRMYGRPGEGEDAPSIQKLAVLMPLRL